MLIESFIIGSFVVLDGRWRCRALCLIEPDGDLVRISVVYLALLPIYRERLDGPLASDTFVEF